METFKGKSFAIVTILTFLQGPVLGQTHDCSVLDAIHDISFFVLGSNLVVTWQEPSNMIGCGFTNIEHRITYSGYQSEQEINTNDYYAYFDYYPYLCVPGVITITASVGQLTSETTTAEYYTETASIENLRIQNENGSLVASWTNPENSEECDFVYQVTYTDNLQEISFETTDLETVLNVTTVSCIQSTVTVTPVDGKYIGVTSTVEHEGEINKVRNYGLTSSDGEVVAVFDPPTDIEYCDLTYEVREEQASCYIKTVSVAAFNGRIYSDWVSGEIEVEINAVENLVATVNGNSIAVSWSVPQGAASCYVSYQVSYSGVQLVSTGTSISLPSALTACVASTIVVSPMSSSGKVGVASEIQVKGALGAVEDLALSSTNSVVTAQWSAPDGSESCALSYILEYTNESGSFWYVTDSTTFDFQYTSCATAVSLTVEPHSEDGSMGPSSTVTLAANC